ncbi:MAG: hypothetical protein SH850_05450 [Planctomycetaceae bacterium]|nr:hypothetical protein [Planctomycetaceae bacterium]
MVMIETLEEWEARQGGSGIFDRGRVLFPSGAMTDERGYQRWEPPAQDAKRLANQKWYRLAQLEAAEREFNSAKQSMYYRSHWAARGAMGGLTPADAELLKALKKVVTHCRRELAKVEKLIANTPEEKQRRLYEEMEAERQQRQSLMLAEVSAIEV